MNIQFPPLERWQERVYKGVIHKHGRIYVVKSKRQVGKTILAVVLMIYFAVTKKKSVSVVVEPTLGQSRRVFKQMQSFLENTGIIKNANASLLTMDFINGSEVLFKSAEQEDALRGFTVSGILVIDEGAFIKDEIYDILFPTTDVHSAPILIISTPLFQSGRFFELYTTFTEGIIHYDWGRYDTSKYLSPETLEMYRKTMSPNKFMSEYLGQFIEEGSYIFGNVRERIGESSRQPKYAGIDFATGTGGDFTVFTLMDDSRCVTDIYAWNREEPTRQVDLLADAINGHPTLEKILAEKNSIGEVYLSYLKKKVMKPQVIQEFVTTNDSKREIIENLVKAFQTGDVTIPDNAELLLELQHYSVERTATGKVTYNGENGFHDDYCISLALALHAAATSKGTYSLSLHRNGGGRRTMLRDRYA